MAFYWKPYVPVAQRRANAKKEMEKLRKKGRDIQPVEIRGRTIARSFWGKGWCDHLESFSDFDNRLPRGRTYVRNGSVCHLKIEAGRIEAIVNGSELYKIEIEIKPLKPSRWKRVKDKCRGRIGSMLELLQGRLSDHVMAVVSDRKQGLFPQPGEIRLACSCPDWAVMCKHVAAVLYGIGSRLDSFPELLFVLRGVNADELIAAEVALPGTKTIFDDALAETDLGKLFDIDLDDASAPSNGSAKPKKTVASASKNVRQKNIGRSKSKEKAVPSLKVSNARAQGKQNNSKKRTPEKPARPIAKKKSKAKSKPAFNPDAPTRAAIVRLRRQSSLSQAQFAQALGVSLASVQRWECCPGKLRIYTRPLAALVKFQKKYSSTKPDAITKRKALKTHHK